MPAKHNQSYVAIGLLLAGITVGTASLANDCKTINRDSAIAKLVSEHEGSKVLKVEEALDTKGCTELKVRILIDGTIKAVTISNGA